ncbi:hypothetical protein FRB90_003150 [Tulasnella sp. 427]|nr:hypothetical protein FRB90_003150 [Tulasnella sp. 427]
MKSFIILPLLASKALAWGVAGHEITATIAEILLTDETRDQLCEILPPWTNCHLAPVAAWADKIKSDPWWRSWTSPMHYINPIGDWPSQHCVFGEDGWHMPQKNLFTAINNYTRIVPNAVGEEQDFALRFLIHYIGDLHQPLHLTGRERGGNGIKVRFEHRITSLHGVWDGGLITKAVREIANYTRPVPEKRIERALRGAIYDPYVRFIAKEGLLGWWKNEYSSWALCPTESASLLPNEDMTSQLRFNRPLGQLPVTSKSLADDPDLPACPNHWARALHALNCEVTFPPQLDTPNPHKSSWLERMLDKTVGFAFNPRPDYLELDTPEYTGRIRNEKLVEKLLAMGGVRLAAVLNDLFDPQVDGQTRELMW